MASILRHQYVSRPMLGCDLLLYGPLVETMVRLNENALYTGLLGSYLEIASAIRFDHLDNGKRWHKID